MPIPDPAIQRQFALEVVQKLRAAGFEALWAGGCVRDQLLGRTPKDYDVATNARPPQIRALFGNRRTLALGAAFGVITVLGPRRAGQIEVATFRRDEDYTDGRHPDRVTFSDAQQDALRRDFTINGLFFDPMANRVIDYVDGQADLAARRLRAIGDPRERFREDKLRMLRAVRFAATFECQIEPATLAAVRDMAAEILIVSAERIATEMRRMLTDVHRARAVRLLLETGLASVVFPEIVAKDDAQHAQLDLLLDGLARLSDPGFPLALATLIHRLIAAEGVEGIGKRWRLANKEVERAAWLVEQQTSLCGAPSKPWSVVQPVLVSEGIDDLLAMNEAMCLATGTDMGDIAWCREKLKQPRETLDPPPLVTGDDLLRHGVRRGPAYRRLLDRIRDAQLDGQLHSPAEALALADRLLAERNEPSRGRQPPGD